MRNHLVNALFFSLTVLATLFAVPEAHAAPGDFVTLWGSQQHFDAQAPGGIALDANRNLFATDTDEIQIFNSSGVRIKKFGSYGSGNGQVNHPQGIAVDATGTVYVADTGNDRIEVFNVSGTYLRKWTHPDWATRPPVYVASDGKGKVYVVEGPGVDYGDMVVKVFDSQGTFLRQLGSVGSGNGQYLEIGGVATDANGNVYVVDIGGDRVQIYSPTGTFIRSVVGSNNIFGYGIAVDNGGNIYLTNLDAFDGRVFVYDNSGNFIRSMKVTLENLNEEHYWWPVALAVDSLTNTYTVDFNGDGIRVFDSAGNVLSQWWLYGTELGQLSRPTGLATDSSGNLYETDADEINTGIVNDRVQVFSPTGTALRQWNGNFCLTAGLTINGGNVYVLDIFDVTSFVGCQPSSTGLIFNSSGSFLGTFGPAVQDQNLFGITFDKSGNILVTDIGNNNVRVLDKNGNLLKTFGSAGTGNGQFNTPKGIATDASGNIYVVDSGNARVEVFNSAYTYIRKWGGPGSSDGLFLEPAGIAIDASGHVYVTDAGNNRIQVFNTSGTFLLKWGRLGDYNGQFREPQGITLGNSGSRVYVADTGNNRIQVFEGYPVTAYSMSGTVRQGSATGTVLAGATVAIAGKTSTTSSTGTFSFTGIPAGTYTVTISKAGFVTKTVTGYVISSNQSGVVFYLSPAYTLSGTVRVGSTTGPVLAGATVAIAGKTSTTSSTGTFSITGIAAGSYTLTISKTGYVTRTITGYAVSGNKSGLVFYLSPAYSISGVVRQGSSTGAVLAGATVAIAGKKCTTSSTGTFSITGIPAGTYTLTISKTGFATKTITGYVINSNKSGLVLYLTPVYWLSGTVRVGSTTGPVLAGATVAISGKTAITGSTGTFSITGIAAGTYTLTISKTGYVTKTITGYVINGNKSGTVFYLTQ